MIGREEKRRRKGMRRTNERIGERRRRWTPPTKPNTHAEATTTRKRKTDRIRKGRAEARRGGRTKSPRNGPTK